MTNGPLRAARRSDGLSKTRIVRAAIETLDEGGTEALTFRALATRLSTGPGAIYHHITDKNDLLAAAADELIRTVLATVAPDGASTDIRALMLAAYDAISEHPWLGTRLVAAPWQPAVLRLFDRVGTELDGLQVPAAAQFDAASVLVHHLLGTASQYDAGRRLTGMERGRPAFLESASAKLTHSDEPDAHPFTTRIARQLAAHDDREQFSVGVDIILAGIATL